MSVFDWMLQQAKLADNKTFTYDRVKVPEWESSEAHHEFRQWQKNNAEKSQYRFKQSDQCVCQTKPCQCSPLNRWTLYQEMQVTTTTNDNKITTQKVHLDVKQIQALAEEIQSITNKQKGSVKIFFGNYPLQPNDIYPGPQIEADIDKYEEYFLVCHGHSKLHRSIFREMIVTDMIRKLHTDFNAYGPIISYTLWNHPSWVKNVDTSVFPMDKICNVLLQQSPGVRIANTHGLNPLGGMSAQINNTVYLWSILKWIGQRTKSQTQFNMCVETIKKMNEIKGPLLKQDEVHYLWFLNPEIRHEAKMFRPSTTSFTLYTDQELLRHDVWCPPPNQEEEYNKSRWTRVQQICKTAWDKNDRFSLIAQMELIHELVTCHYHFPETMNEIFSDWRLDRIGLIATKDQLKELKECAFKLFNPNLYQSTDSIILNGDIKSDFKTDQTVFNQMISTTPPSPSPWPVDRL